MRYNADKIKLGAELAEIIYADLMALNIKPTLGIVQVGDLDASNRYIAVKKRRLDALGWHCKYLKLDEDTSEHDFNIALVEMSTDQNVHGVIVQLPLPKRYTRDLVDSMPYLKDVDGLGPLNQSMVFMGSPEDSYMAPCTAKACVHLLEANNIKIKGAHVAVLGRSCLVGRPIGMLLQHRGATVVQVNQEDKNQQVLTRHCDILVSAIGVPWYVTPDYVKKDAFVVDIGITRVGDEIRGDVHPDVRGIASFVTPSRGGIGPLTVAFLMKNLAHAYLEQANLEQRYLEQKQYLEQQGL